MKIKISKRLAKQLFVVSILAIYNFFGVFQKQTTRESKFLFFLHFKEPKVESAYNLYVIDEIIINNSQVS